MDLVGNILGSWSTVGSVEFDTEIVVRSTWVVRGGQEDTSVGLVGTDQSGDGRGGENSILTHDDVLDTVTGADTENDLSSLWGLVLAQQRSEGYLNVGGRRGAGEARSATYEETTVTTDDDGLALRSTWHSAEDGLDKVLGVVLLLEDLDLLTETRGTWLLARVGLCLNSVDFSGPALHQCLSLLLVLLCTGTYMVI